MNKLRKIWLAVVLIGTLLFAAYYVYENMKMDSSGPVISGGQDQIEVSIYDTEDVLLQGITATDAKDGDVTDSLLVEKISNFYGNTRLVTYAAFDSDNHISKIEREITYNDYNRPQFEITGSLRFRAGETVNIEKIVNAKDCLDGDISNKVKIRMDTTINNRVTGFYNIEYVVTNSAGDMVVLPIAVEIYAPYNNEVELNLEKYLIYYTGEEINYKDYLKSIRKGNQEFAFDGVELLETEIPEEEPVEAPTDESTDEQTEDAEEQVKTDSERIPKSRVQVESSVDVDKPGVYPVYYYYAEENGNYTYEAKEVLYVVVE